MAAETNRNIVKLSFANPLLADKYTKMCAELLSLSTVVVEQVYRGTPLQVIANSKRLK